MNENCLSSCFNGLTECLNYFCLELLFIEHFCLNQKEEGNKFKKIVNRIIKLSIS